MDIKDLVNYGGFIIGILGILLSFYLYKKGQEKKDPRCLYKTYRNISRLSDNQDSKIKIFYDQKEVSRVFTTYIWIWNNGKKPINKSDIPSQSNIIITLNDDEFTPEILDFQVIKTTRDAINFSVERYSETSLVISFDFLDQDDGAILEVQHKGSGETDFLITGIILGVPDGIKIIETKKKNTRFYRAISEVNSFLDFRKSPKRFFLFTSIALIMFIGMAGFQYYDMRTNVSVRVTSANLREALIAEVPQITEKNISKILNSISENTNLVNQIVFLFMLSYIATMSGLLIYLVWKYLVVPYPKSLKLGDDVIKYERV